MGRRVRRGTQDLGAAPGWVQGLTGTVAAAAIALIVLGADPVRGQGDPNQPQRDKVLSQVDEVFALAGFEEQFHPYSGQVTLRIPVIDLPGRAGLDLTLPAYYSSETYNRVENTSVGTHVASIDPVDHLGGAGWQLHFGKVFNPAGGGSPNSPLIVMPDGSTRLFYSSSAHPGELVSEDRWRYRFNTSTARWELTDIRGNRYEFADRVGFERAISLRNEVIAQCVKVTDVFGNTITAAYASGLIQTITDSFGRTVKFNYVSGSSRLQNVQIKNGSTVLRQWTFGYTSAPLVTWSHQFGTRQVYGLTSIDPPAGPDWDMTYKAGNLPLAQNPYALSKLTLPTGGTITYTYTGKLFDPGCQALSILRAVVASRATGGRDVVAGTWTYAYEDPGEDGMTTTVTGPPGSDASEVYVSEGYGPFAQNDASLWSVGRLRSKVVSDSIQDVEESYSWEEGELLSNDFRYISNWVGCGTLRQDSQIRFVKPETVVRTVRRGSTTWVTTQSLFDDYGNPTAISEDGNVDRSTTLSYWYSTAENILEGRLRSRVQSPGTRECYSFYATGTISERRLNPTSCTATDGIKTTYLYDDSGQLTDETTVNTGNDSATLRKRQLRNYSYGVPELEILPVTVASMSDVRINRNITVLGQVDWEEDGRQGIGYRTDFAYDALGRLTGIDPPAGLTTTIAYAADGASATVTRGTNPARSYETTFDGFGRKRTWEDLQRGDKEVTSYDSLGRKRETQLYAGGLTADRHVFDVLGRLTLIDHPGTTAIDYDYSGNVVTVTDEAGDVTTLNYQAFGDPADRRLSSVRDAADKFWDYGYHSSYGLLSSITAPTGFSGANRSFTYTTKRFVDAEDHPETGTIDHGYSAAGDRVRTSKGGVTVNYKYDGPGRLWRVDAPVTAQDVEFRYDQASNPTRIANGAATYVQLFDGAKRLTKRTATLGGRAFVTEYDWDGHDRLRTVTYPSGRTVTYTYDSDGRVDGIETSAGSPYVTSIIYRPHGGVDILTYGNGAFTDFTYDSRFRPSFLTTQQRNLDVGYDEASRIDLWTTAGRERTFTYDALGRLDLATGPRGEQMNFGHNAVGNRTTLVIDGVTETYAYAAGTQRLTSVSGGYTASYGYDSQGRLTSTAGRTLSWTALDRVATVTGGGVSASYAYDGEGRRVKATVNGATRWFVLDPWGKILAEYNGAGSLLVEHVYLGDRRIASRRTNGDRSYIQHDPLGSAWIVTSDTGSAYRIYDYWPFGEPAPDPAFDRCAGAGTDAVFCDGFKSGDTAAWTCVASGGGCAPPPAGFEEPLYTGKQLDEETDWFYFEARQMDPRIGRFVSPDQGAPQLENPQTINRYAYALNSPFKYHDPDGNIGDTVLDVLGIVYDAYDIGRSLWRGDDVTKLQWAALGADVVGAAVPFATGGGALVRAAAKADDIKNAAKGLQEVSRGAKLATRNSDELVTIGRRADTAIAKDWPGHRVLDIADWTLAKNDAWVKKAIDEKAVIYLASPPTPVNLYDNVAGRSTVFGREYRQFLEAGYTQQGVYLVPPR